MASAAPTRSWKHSDVEAFELQSSFPLRILLSLVATTLGAGLFGRGLARAASGRRGTWLWVAFGVGVTHVVTLAEPPGVRMLFLISITFVTMKLVVLVASYARGSKPLTPWLWLLFALAWPGMRPDVLRKRTAEPPKLGGHLAWGLGCTGLGIVLMQAAILLSSHWESRWGPTALLLTGCSLVLHFGCFRIVVAGWRALRFDCRPVFRAPILATSLGEFWGKRWNVGFTEMLQEAVYRPLLRTSGRTQARLASFAVSGLLHEIAISLPVGGGYGLPTAYFVLQGWLVHRENDSLPRRRRILVALQLLIPIPLLAHLPFLRGVVWPWLSLSA